MSPKKVPKKVRPQMSQKRYVPKCHKCQKKGTSPNGTNGTQMALTPTIDKEPS